MVQHWVQIQTYEYVFCYIWSFGFGLFSFLHNCNPHTSCVTMFSILYHYSKQTSTIYEQVFIKMFIELSNPEYLCFDIIGTSTTFLTYLAPLYFIFLLAPAIISCFSTSQQTSKTTDSDFYDSVFMEAQAQLNCFSLLGLVMFLGSIINVGLPKHTWLSKDASLFFLQEQVVMH